MQFLAPPSGKTESLRSQVAARYRVLVRVFLTVVLHSSVVAPVLKLRMPKVACLQGHNVIGKKRLSYRLLKHTMRKCRVITHLSLRARGSKLFPRLVIWVYGEFSGMDENMEIVSDNGELIKNNVNKQNRTKYIKELMWALAIYVCVLAYILCLLLQAFLLVSAGFFPVWFSSH